MNTLDTGPAFHERLNLGALIPILRRHWMVAAAATLSGLMLAAIIVIVSPREYRANATIMIVPSQNQEIQARGLLNVDTHGFQEIERFYRTQVQMFKSRTFAERVAKAYFERTGEEVRAKWIADEIEVFPIERSHLVQIGIVDTIPERAALLTNLAAQAFVEENLERRRELARDANRWIEERIATAEAKRAEAVTRLLAFKDDHDIIDRDESKSTGALSALLEAVERQYGELAAERVLLESRVNTHARLLREGDFDALVGMIDLPISADLRKEYAGARSRVTSARAIYGERHPELGRAQEALAQVQEQLASEVTEAVRVERERLKLLRQQERDLTDERDSTKAQVLEAQRLAAEYRDLQRQLFQIEETLVMLLKRRDELALVSETRLNNAYPVDAATPPTKPVKPKVVLTLGAGLAVGLFIGILGAMARGLMDESILHRGDIETFFKTPVIGVIPHAGADQANLELLPYYTPTSSLAEAVRGIRTILERTPDGQPTRHLLVTSSIASEGKTAIAVQLGTTFAQQGKKVLLLEGDHRRPRLHAVFGATRSRPGLVDILDGRASIDEVATPTLVPGLWLITRGSVQGRSWETLTGTAMRTFMEEAAEAFDLIIIDTPPSAGLSDAIDLARFVDRVVLVAKAGAITRPLLGYTQRRFEQAGHPVSAIILNAIQPRAGQGAYYYYSQQGYYYASEEDEAAS